MSMHPYRRFLLMIVVATVIMYALMYLNVESSDHIFFSESRAFMAIIMGAAMAAIMLGFMRSMYQDKRLNTIVYGASLLVFVLALWLVRSQSTVGDVSYMKAMIPHHSIAILTSERAHISDPRVRALADNIIRAQRREIAEMKGLISDIEGGR